MELTANVADLVSLDEDLARLENFQIDLQPLADLIAQQLIEENRSSRLAGLDKDDDPLVEVTHSTRLRRERDGGDINAPALIPHGEESRVVANLFVRVTPQGERLLIESGWTGAGWLRYHAEGSGHLPVRDILALSPESLRWLSDVLGEFVRLRVREHLMGDTFGVDSVADLPLLRDRR